MVSSKHGKLDFPLSAHFPSGRGGTSKIRISTESLSHKQPRTQLALTRQIVHLAREHLSVSCVWGMPHSIRQSLTSATEAENARSFLPQPQQQAEGPLTHHTCAKL